MIFTFVASVPRNSQGRLAAFPAGGTPDVERSTSSERARVSRCQTSVRGGGDCYRGPSKLKCRGQIDERRGAAFQLAESMMSHEIEAAASRSALKLNSADKVLEKNLEELI